MTNGNQNVRFMKLGSLALLGGAGAVLLLWLVFLFAGATSTPPSGVDDVHGFLIRLTTAVPAVLLIMAHLAVARTLAAEARARQ